MARVFLYIVIIPVLGPDWVDNTIMSSNKTVVPGMAPQGFSFQGPAQPGFTQNPQAAPMPAGTVFPGAAQAAAAQNQKDDNHKPIMGFLYSVSRTSAGEFWPIYLGPNTIGRGMDAGITLAEQTVSDNHCKIVAQELKSPDRLFVYIQECGSTCGTMVNGNSLDFNPREIKHGDIITVGEHYELYVVLIDTRQIGIAVKEDFLPVQIQNPNPPFNGGGFIPPTGPVNGPRPTTPAGGFQPGQPMPDPKPFPGTVIDGGQAW